MSETKMNPEMHIYEVGMMSDKCKIKAPTAGAAAMYYGLRLVTTNNPFMTACYSVDGQPYTEPCWWIFIPTEKTTNEEIDTHVRMVAGLTKHLLDQCEVAE